MNNIPKARQKNLVIQESERELLIYDLLINKALCLNDTSAMVWQLCNGENSIADIHSAISKRLKENISEDFIWLAIDGLKKENLLENGWAIENGLTRFSRREAIRKIGLASLVTLPVISSLIAPTSATAASGGKTCGTLNPNESTFYVCNFLCRGPHSAEFCNQSLCKDPSMNVGADCKSCSAHAIFDPFPDGGACNYTCVCD